MITVATTVGANRIVRGTAITHTLGDPSRTPEDERHWREQIVRTALQTLLVAPPEGQVFEPREEPGGRRNRTKLLLPVHCSIDLASPFSRGRIWSGRRDSNSRPLQPHCSALPGCATPRPSAAAGVDCSRELSRRQQVFARCLRFPWLAPGVLVARGLSPRIVNGGDPSTSLRARKPRRYESSPLHGRRTLQGNSSASPSSV